MSKSLADNPFITEMKDKNGDSWYHQIVLELKDKEINRLNDKLKLYDALNNGEIKEIKISRPEQVFEIEETNKDKEIERLNNIIKEVREYIESYNLKYLHETNEHNLADILEELLEIIGSDNNG